jgi:ribonuclease PH
LIVWIVFIFIEERCQLRSNPRKIVFTPNINPYAHGSVLVEFGNTKVHVTAIVQEEVPPFLKGQGKGWVTAEYSMLPGATHTRNQRERKSPSSRSLEIQRLIGRSLRAAIDTKLLGERSILIDCDVLVADGGTRTTSVSGGFVALALAIDKLMQDGLLTQNPLKRQIAALSVGISKTGEILADLNYQEDSSCDTDLNIVMTSSGDLWKFKGQQGLLLATS